MLSANLLRYILILTALVCTATAEVLCDSATIESVRSAFQADLKYAGLEHSCSQHNTTVISSVTNETAWRYLGCLPELKSLTVAICSYDNSRNLSLPAEWGAAASFPNLVELIIEGRRITGTLPEAWGSPHSFPQLLNLTVKGSTFLEGPLPESWGSNGSMPLLKSLVIHTDDDHTGCNLCSRHDRPTAFTSQLPLSWGQGSSFLALETLGLFGLNLIGSLPAEWGCPRCFINLQVLQIAGSSNLTGSLPVDWSASGSFQSLKVLNLAAASLTGSIPPTWVTRGAFDAVTYLSLANTTLTGAIPSFSMRSLAVLDLSFSSLSGNISDLWRSTSTTISAIGLTGVNVTGAFPYELPRFWKSMRTLVVDNTLITGTVPTSWLATASVSQASTYSKSWTVNSQMQSLSFSGLKLWDRSFKDPAWWPEVCSSFSKLAGYGTIYDMPQVHYAGIKTVVRPSLDVTRKLYYTQRDELPTLPSPDRGPVGFYSQDPRSYYTSFLEDYIDNFQLNSSYKNLPSPIEQCPAAPWATPVIAAWAAFGAVLLALAAGFIMWRWLVRWRPAVVAWRPTTSLQCKIFRLCGLFSALLGLGLYVYNLITDVLVVVVLWDIRFWWAKVVLVFILVQYVVRGFIVTIHLCRADRISPSAPVLIFWSTLFRIVLMPVFDVLCSLNKGLHHPLFEVIHSHRYRHLRIFAVSVLQALPNAAVVTVIYHQGTVPFSLDYDFSLLGALDHNTDPHFLSRSLFLQAVVSSLACVAWGMAGWLFLSQKQNTGLFKTLWSVISCTASTPPAPKEAATQLPARTASTYCMVHQPGSQVQIATPVDVEAPATV